MRGAILAKTIVEGKNSERNDIDSIHQNPSCAHLVDKSMAENYAAGGGLSGFCLPEAARHVQEPWVWRGIVDRHNVRNVVEVTLQRWRPRMNHGVKNDIRRLGSNHVSELPE